jgi:hypothetical protein
MNPLDNLTVTPVQHHQLLFFGAALAIAERVGQDAFPFLGDYCGEVGPLAPAAWDALVAAWAQGADIPLQRLAAIDGVGADGVRALILAGLVNEDARFGAVFEHFTGQPHPNAALLHTWWPQLRAPLRRLGALGLVQRSETEATLQVPHVAWEAARGEAPATHRPAGELLALEALILPHDVQAAAARAPAVLASGQASAIVVRGPESSGRRTLVGAIARAGGHGVLAVAGDDRLAGPLATLLGALPVAVLDVPSGETVALAPLDGWSGPLGVVIGRSGSVTGAALDRAITFTLGIPGIPERERHWAQALGRPDPGLATALRMTGGNIRRTAATACAEAALAGRAKPIAADIARGARLLQERLLDTLATRVATEADWGRLAVGSETMAELRLLEARCRHRERIGASLGAAAGSDAMAGVRALLSGPSGTGKTLAARTLAGVLGIDLYRVDLSAVVNKYLGETEKNLHTLFARAEEADAALLLDEGDALLTRRTDVQTSNDRYANLETNFLLQRLESFEGILLVTTNAGERIDEAFRRRMDVVVEFGVPDETERWAIWRLHLPYDTAVSTELIDELAVRCDLTGGQMRNAVLHAALLALDAELPIDDGHLRAAVTREYVKAGRISPLGQEVGFG